jgi:site-specific recombinase XerD
MKDFLNYLIFKRIVSEKQAHFYQIWVSKFIKFLNGKPVEKVDDEDISRYINKDCMRNEAKVKL